ncbi:MAG: hypothetical protein FWD74_11335, partial [Actinomycetia bacterium]|nr:hypothetical protein [Actinomycetes bacterium]
MAAFSAPDSGSPDPTVAGDVFAVIILGVLFAVVPAAIRLVIRKVVARRAPAPVPVGGYAPYGYWPAGSVSPVPAAVSPPGAPPQPPAWGLVPPPLPPSPPPVPPPLRATSDPAAGGPRPEWPPESGTTPAAAAPEPSPASGARLTKDRPTLSPADVLDTSSLAGSSALLAGRRTLPFPAGRAIHAVQVALDRKDQYEATIDSGDALTLCLGITVAAWLRSINPRSEAVAECMAALIEAIQTGGAAQGHWLGMLERFARLPEEVGEPFAGARAAFRRAKGGRGLLNDLDELLRERNLSAHGGRPRNPFEAGARLLDGERHPPLGSLLEDAVERVAGLAATQWVLIESGKYTRDGVFQVDASLIMGDNPSFDRIKFNSPVPLVDGDLYFRGPHGHISLTPFVLMRYCETCRQPELCYLDRVDNRKGAVLKSFANGHA